MAGNRASTLFAICAVMLCSTICTRSEQATIIPVIGYRIIHVYPHDRRAFTEGLACDGSLLYESTGLQGESEVRIVRLETGEVVRRRKLDAQYFGEGLTLWHDRIIQLTYQSSIGFVYDRRTLEQRQSFAYAAEGWGLTTDGKRLIASDGTATLRFFDPTSFRETGRVTVRAGSEPVTNLNELEFVRGQVLANVWRTRIIARIDPKTGQVRGWIDLSGILDDEHADVMNGIAYDGASDRLFVTGKWWPKLFEIAIEPK